MLLADFMKKVVTFAIPVHGREKILDFCIKSLVDRINSDLNDRFEFRILLGGDIESVIWWHNLNFVEIPNEPLGKKFDDLINTAFLRGSDYVILLGSDDIISHNYIYELQKIIDKGIDFATVEKCFFVNAETLKVKFVKTPICGTGLLIGSEVWSKAGNKYGNIYPRKNKGMDEAHGKLAQFSKTGKAVQMNSAILDIKTNENIWKFSSINLREYDTDILKDYFIKDIEKLTTLNLNLYGKPTQLT